MGAIDPTMSVQEATHLLKQTLPKIIFVSLSAVTLVEKVVDLIGTNSEIVVFGETEQHTPFSKFIQPHKNEDSFKPREVENLNQMALIIFSSGSTGMPKAICYSHRNMLCFTKTNQKDVQVLYCVVNPYWTVFTTFLQISIEHGFPRIVYPTFDLNDIWTLYYQPVDYAFLNPVQTLQMIRSKKSEQANLKHVKALFIGGNPLTAKEFDEIKLALPHTQILLGYSQTESFNIILCFWPKLSAKQHYQNNVCSAGTITHGISYKIVDIETEKTLGPNEVGELRIKSPSQFIGYYNTDSSECFDADGWLKTGDLCYYTENLYFYIVDRIKESFKFLYHHISPAEIETVISNLESIEAVVVIGVPHKTDFNHPMAVVKLRPNAKTISAEEIIKHVENNLEDKKRLRAGVKFVDAIPMTVTGKINRFKVKQMVLNSKL